MAQTVLRAVLAIGGRTFPVAHRSTVNKLITIYEDTLDEDGDVASSAVYNLTGAAIVFGVSDDREQLFTKSSASSSQIEISPQSGDTIGQCTLKLTALDTDPLEIGGRYFYDVWVYKTNGEVVEAITQKKFKILDTAFEPTVNPPEGDPGSGQDMVVNSLVVDGAPVYGRFFDIRAYGAVDGQDSSAAIRLAVAAANAATEGGTVYIPRGTWYVTRDSTNFYAINVLSGVSFEGQGSESAIKLLAGDYGGLDMFMFNIDQKTDVAFHNLQIDGNKANITNPDEHTHCIRVYRSTNILVRRVRFKNSHGDGIFLLGETSPNQTKNINIQNCSFRDSNRNGITFQREVYFSRVEDSDFSTINDTPIDCEPSGGPMGDNLIAHNYINHTGQPVAWALTLSGATESDPNTRMIVRDNIILGSVQMVRTRDLLMEGNYILGSSGVNALFIQGMNERCKFLNNQFLPVNGQACVGIVPQSGIVCTNSRWIGNTLISDTSGLAAEVCAGLRFEDNHVERTGVVANTPGVQFRATIAGCRDISVKRNTFIGWVNGVHVSVDATHPINGIHISDNAYHTVTTARRFETGGALITDAVLGTERYTSVTTELTGIAAIEPVTVGGVGRNTCGMLFGTADPTAGGGVQATMPCIYMRTDGTIYRKSGAGATAWTAM
jgi:hypothetical protein